MVVVMRIKANHPEVSVWVNFIEIHVRGKRYRVLPSKNPKQSQLRSISRENIISFVLNDAILTDNKEEVSPEGMEALFTRGVVTEVSLSLAEGMRTLPEDYFFCLPETTVSLRKIGKTNVRIPEDPRMVRSVEVNSERVILDDELLMSKKEYEREYEEIRIQKIKAEAAGEKIWKVPVSWQACGHYFVRAKSFEEAAKYIEKAKDIPLPVDADFIDSTFEVDYEGKGIHNDEDGTVDPIDTTTIYTATSSL